MAEIQEFTSKQARKQMVDYEKTIDRLIERYGKLDKAIAALNREIKKEEKTTKKLSEAQKLANSQKNKLNKVNAKLAASENKLTKQLILQEEKQKAVTKAMREQAKATLGIKKANGLFKSVTKSIIAAGAAMISFQAAFRIFGSSIKTIANFEQAMSKVRAVTGALPKDFKALNDNAKLLGETTSKSASQVAGLQLEFAKLGFSTKEILNATEATISLSIAAGSDLADSAVVAASTVRGFGLSADETQRVVDVMAKSFASSALDLEKFKTSMAAVAPVAKANGKDIEFVTARLSVLTDAGVDASTAGTSLRNMFLNLSKEGLTWEEGLEKINTAQDKNVAALDLFGKRGATAALIIADNIQKAKGLEKSYDGASGAAEEMARIMEDNLIGDTKKLSSAWEGWILSSSNGVIKLGRQVVQFATKVLGVLNSKTEEQIDLRRLDNREMNASFNALKNVNLSQEARLKLIDNINKEYGEYLPNLLNEKSSIDDIAAAQEAANKQFRVKIIQQAFEEEMTEVLKKEAKAYEEVAEAQIEAAEASQVKALVTDEAELATLKLIESGSALREEAAQKVIDKNEKEVEATRDKFKKIAELYNIAFSEIENVLNKSSEKEIENTEKTGEENIKKRKNLAKKELETIARITTDQRIGHQEDANKKLIDNTRDAETTMTDIVREQEAIRSQLRQQAFSQAVDLVNAAFSLGQAQRNAEASEIQLNYDKQIKAAEGNDAAQERLEKQKAEKLYQIELESAKAEKRQAVFNTIISAAQGSAQIAIQAAVLAANPLTAALAPLAYAQLGLVAATTAVQLAAIQAQPLPNPPQFALGTDYSPSTFIAGESGRELMIDRQGNAFLTPNAATLYTGMEGTQILPNAQTESIMRMVGTGDVGTDAIIGSKLDKVINAIENNKTSISLDKSGAWRVSQRNQAYNTRRNRKLNIN